jgi:16S rRNA (guanine527-N7)-methyltransferase
MTVAAQLLRSSNDMLAAGVRELGVTMPDGARDKLDAFVALLAKWNRTYNLTAIREPERMVTHHLLDALAVLPHLPQIAALRLLDVGSGGGVPGIPLAIARPRWSVALVDASHKKATFLAQAAAELGLRNVSAHATRIEAFAPAAPFDVVISRAFADLRTFAETSSRHLAGDGMLVAMKGVHPDEEIAELPDGIAMVAAPKLRVPGLDAARHLIVMRRKERDA